MLLLCFLVLLFITIITFFISAFCAFREEGDQEDDLQIEYLSEWRKEHESM